MSESLGPATHLLAPILRLISAQQALFQARAWTWKLSDFSQLPFQGIVAGHVKAPHYTSPPMLSFAIESTTVVLKPRCSGGDTGARNTRGPGSDCAADRAIE